MMPIEKEPLTTVGFEKLPLRAGCRLGTSLWKLQKGLGALIIDVKSIQEQEDT